MDNSMLWTERDGRFVRALSFSQRGWDHMGLRAIPAKKELKQYVVMRTDLGMGIGKMVAQAMHGAAETPAPGYTVTRIAVKVNSEKELQDTLNGGQRKGIRSIPIHDAGKTQVAPGTMTCVVFGPDSPEKMDAICGHLKLL